MLGVQVVIQNVCKNILPRSNATYALNASLEHTTCVLIFGHTQTSVHLYVPYAEKRLLDNMTGNGTRVYIPVRKSLYVVGSLKPAGHGVVAGALLGRMH